MAVRQAEGFHEHIFSRPWEQFTGNPWAIIKALEDFLHTAKGRFSLIYGAEKAKISSEYLSNLSYQPKIIVEFGAFIGSSALAWGATLKDLNGGKTTGIHVYSFELEEPVAKIARDFVELAGLKDVVTIIQGPGAESLKKLFADGKITEHGVDMVFMDHWKGFYLPDLKLCEELKLFHEGSVILADNTDFPGAPDYLDYVQKGGSGAAGAVKYESKTIDTVGKGQEGQQHKPVSVYFTLTYHGDKY